jgi:hypothetical protein
MKVSRINQLYRGITGWVRLCPERFKGSNVPSGVKQGVCKLYVYKYL